jgi:hypothetical protein
MLKMLVGCNDSASGTYTEQQKLVASDAATADFFGAAVSLSSDGSVLIVGAYGEDTSPYFQNGAAYVFTRAGATWTQQQKLTASDPEDSALFGIAVAMSSDGNTAIVGARAEDTSPNTDNGAAYVFTRSGSVWSQQAKLLASDSESNALFGCAVALSADGNTAIIGARREDTSPSADNGAAYVFTRSGVTWSEQQKLTASDAASDDFFGTSVALSSNGNTAIIGAIGEDTSPSVQNGAAYVFTRSGSTWTEQQKLTANDLASSDQFGISVALSSNGDTAVVGADLEDTSPTLSNGAAYVFTRSGSTWTQQQKLLASDPNTDDNFGRSVAVSADGNIAVVGAYSETTPPYLNNGAAYVFTRSGVTWTQKQKILASDLASNDFFGTSVTMSAGASVVVIGADGETSQAGAAYVFAS